ncbi:MAG: hypothetical protein WAV47_19835 [Blastocatellia bacterium]
MRDRLQKSFAGIAAFSFVLMLASPGFAQVGRWSFGSRYRAAEVARLLRLAETRSDQFAMLVDRSRGRFEQTGRWDDRGTTRRDERLSDRARELERQLDIATQELSRTGNVLAVRSEVANAISMAHGINNAIRFRRTGYGSGVDRQWMLLRSDLNRLARVYNLRQLA